MISVEEAQQKVIDCSRTNAGVTLPLDQAMAFALVSDLYAPMSLPSFRQSAMDGYAIRYESGHEFKVVGEVQAGSAASYTLAKGEAVRIFTGAAVPDSANVVVMQEWVNRAGDIGKIEEGKEIREGANIRPIGEQLDKGDLVFPAGTRLNAASIGLLRSFGMTEVKVHQKPRISIVVTGDELVAAGEQLAEGQIYESNAITLSTAIEARHFGVAQTIKVKDDKAEIKAKLGQALEENDLVIVSGGISVGEYDFVGEVLLELGVEQQFYKVNQKPGKPIFFGTFGNKLVFALPGNPAASLSCLIEYVLPAIKCMSGYSNPKPLRIQLPLASDYANKGSRSKFLKGIVADGQVTITDGQASSMLHSFALANGLVYLPQGGVPVLAGQLVEVHLI